MYLVDQNKIRRNGVGLRAYNPKKSFKGYTLFTPMNGDGTIYLINMDGTVVHHWEMPYSPGLYGQLLENGNLLYSGKVLDDLDRFEQWGRWKGGAVLEVDWEGNILWKILHPDHHHDAHKLKNGNVLLLCLTTIPQELVARIRGGIQNTEANGQIYGDYLIELTTSGKQVWEWKSWEHLDPDVDIITMQDKRAEWTHGNTVSEMSNGDILVSFRNISTVVAINKQSGLISWKLGSPPLAQQHDPKQLSNGNILIFDNGTHRSDHPVPHSRVIEIDPSTNEIVWTYQEPTSYNFFSPYISGAQRLGNGNTLICEGNFGRLFEVTSKGELVWEFVNPYFHIPTDAPNSPSSNSVFRAFRYTQEQLPYLTTR